MMEKKLSYFLLSVSLALAGSAQQWEFVQKRDLFQIITAVDAGSLGKVYVGTERGNIYSFLADGTPDSHYSSSIFQPVTTIDASNSLRVFVYYKNVAQFEFLERFSAQSRIYNLSEFGLESADLAALGSNGTIWFLNGQEVIQTNPFNHTILSRQNLEADLDLRSITHLAMDQVLQLSDLEKGIILDATTTRKMRIETTGVRFFTFEDNELIALGDEGVLMQKKSSNRPYWIEPPGAVFSMVLKSGVYFHFVKGSEIHTYRLEE